MSESYLERTLGSTLPTFHESWGELRRTYPPHSPPTAEDYLGHLVAHVEESLATGRVAEVTRLFLAVERVLTDADPILEDLLERNLLGALAEHCRDAGIAESLVLPHLGPMSRAAWERAT